MLLVKFTILLVKFTMLRVKITMLRVKITISLVDLALSVVNYLPGIPLSIGYPRRCHSSRPPRRAETFLIPACSSFSAAPALDSSLGHVQ